MSEDWDVDGGSSTPASSGYGSASGSFGMTSSKGGFGRGWGRGMGFSDNKPDTKPGGTFGGFQSNNVNNNDDGWNEDKENDSGNTGGSFGGFKSKFGGGGFGSRNDDDSDTPRGGGFGKKSFGGNAGGGGKGCFNCGKDGHMSRDCPNPKKSGGRPCYNCGEEGHMSRDCPNPKKSGGGGDGTSSRPCYNCGEEGHMSRDCPNPKKSGGGGGGGRSCYNCGEDGHMSKDCPNPSKNGGGGGGGGGGSGCFNCGEEGHQKKDCPKPLVGQDGKPREVYIPPTPTEDEDEMFRSIQQGINFDKYDDIPVEVTGRDAPKNISRFEESGIYCTCMNNVRKAKYYKPTPVQKYAIPIILKKRDLMACAQTGSGKTAAFLLPIITSMVTDNVGSTQFADVQKPECIVIAPTRELALQIYMEARKFALGTIIRPVVVYGGTSTAHQARQVKQGVNILVATPGRLMDFLEKNIVSFENTKYLVLDEADRMLDMGFGPVVRKMVEESGMPSKAARQTLMFSATFPEEIQRLAADFLNDYLFLTVGRVGGANTDVQQAMHQIDTFDKRQKLCDIISETGSDRTLVFVETKRNADFLASYLSQSGFPTTSIHGDRMQREREEALGDFRTGKAPILVATGVAARGLDIPDVKHVVNYDLPKSIDEYVHRIGRTGRCGNLGKATSFYCHDQDGPISRSLVKILSDAQQEVPAWLESAAEGSIGTGGFTGVGGQFGGKDVRRGKSTGRRGGDDDWGDAGMGNSGGGFSSAAFSNNGFQGTAAEEESWD